MQSAKDAFHVALRDRIAQVNPGRTVVVRGVERVAVLAEENELVNAVVPTDAFVLRWGGVEVDGRGALPMLRMECVIRYETAGSAGVGGLDRGRMLAGMDAELMEALLAAPQWTVRMDLSVSPAVTLSTRVFWGTPAFGAGETVSGRTGRAVSVPVYSYEEAAER